MRHRVTVAVLAALLAVPTAPAAAARRAAPAELLQAAGEGQGLVLRTQARRSWLVSPEGRRQRLPVRRGESLTELVEYARGWAAAGTRATDGGSDLLVLVDGAAGVERLPPPPQRTAAVRVAPVPLASDHGFGGVAWLEGDDPISYQVRVADWSGADWSPPEAVSGPAAGGHAGLVAAVLDDGGWLLVWSAGDGRSGGELWWSVRRGGGWSEPRPVTDPNRVPDITPTLLATPGGGALLVWARQTRGGYRLLAASFDGSGWGPARPLGGVGGVFPRFVSVAGTSLVVARAPGGWAVLEVDRGGYLRRHESHAASTARRPVLTLDEDGLALAWDRGSDRLRLGWQVEP